MVLGVVVANCSGDHFRRMRSWRHLSEALNRLLRGSFGLVSIRFQHNTGLYGTAVAIKNKPAPDNPLPTRIFSEPITIITLRMSHQAIWLGHSAISRALDANPPARSALVKSGKTQDAHIMFASPLKADKSRVWQTEHTSEEIQEEEKKGQSRRELS